MAFCLNRVQLLGHVGKDPQVRTLQTGSVATLSLATSESWTDKRSGEKREKTEWHDIVVWAPPLVEMIRNRVRKGTRLMIEGAIQTRKWTDKDGTDRYTREIVVKPYTGNIWLLGSIDARQPREPAGEEEDGSGWGQGAGFTATSFSDGGGFDKAKAGAAVDDEIPF